MSPERARLQWHLKGEEATLALGAALGRLLGPGAVVLLTGRLGAGKTVLARGLAAGLGVSGDYAIVSPTFTLLNQYPGRVEFFHADLYRLAGGEAAELELLEEAAAGVLAVEWAERATELWPPQAIGVELADQGRGARLAIISGPREIISNLEDVLGREEI
ncbi:MAG: tRNA (adenosine(37)-N6)-threonylcarbamoyltransferase complex ATPase subunit type 1 TsaE [Desulfarculaceae bacterium]|nr:tRNA (adenosine(37)-N6)-threonylcarbamoyltransferase complex ATPase subunit type 1 TsaE [Desulfarculaceae bacterium]MCF8049083.1 tRNA (adenosine(37)-N6)-threonylcarbamoyltransferase complex ATPase subunit type 1 TsaE [Desulfarculaceae bacterium]MCF8099503.1 tRNA (adenosine(37)-N6)-threonylcarbamoyltransferase complex ATPase subunit type 1 TsaE [Desulfarculaceae bacterium]MCF8123962.1 tRNA (adenosine(37)-N6)-threonylcarbamoyltransferase complex ATPase subunit type 1 TsaE [Desulfarculaceae bact